MLRAVILDWNGTACNDLEATLGSMKAIFEHYQVPAPSFEVFSSEITANFMEFYHRHGIPKSAAASDLGAIRKEYFEKHWYMAELRDGVRELLEFSREQGIRTAIVSAETEAILQRHCALLSLTNLVDWMQADARLKELALRDVLKRFGVEPGRAVYIDDTADGLDAAHTVGMRTIGFTSGYHSWGKIMQSQPDFPNDKIARVDSFHTVIEIVKVLADGRLP